MSICLHVCPVSVDSKTDMWHVLLLIFHIFLFIFSDFCLFSTSLIGEDCLLQNVGPFLSENMKLRKCGRGLVTL